MKKLTLAISLLSSSLSLIAQDIHTRDNGAAQNTVLIVRSYDTDDKADIDHNSTSDIDFQIWDSNTNDTKQPGINPQGRIGIVGPAQNGSLPQESSGRMSFQTANLSNTLVERMRIDEEGNVGIGTTTPDVKLDVNGKIKCDGILGSLNVGGVDLTLGKDGARSLGVRTRQRALVHNHNDVLQVNFNNDFEGGTLINGYVNIAGGTSVNEPGGFRLTVDGKIGSRGMVCKLGSWADYVFYDDYKLKTLGEVESYIDANGHLPGVPSEEEVKTDGLDISEMQKIQMEKLEELTLYMIEQNKKIEELEKELKKLKQ